MYVHCLFLMKIEEKKSYMPTDKEKTFLIFNI